MSGLQKINENLSFLHTLQRNEVRAGLTLSASDVTLSYIGRILTVHGAGLESWVSIHVDHAMATFITQASLDEDSAFTALREAREAVTPSADKFAAVASDLDLRLALDAAYDTAGDSVILTAEEGQTSQFLLRSITGIIGIEQP